MKLLILTIIISLPSLTFSAEYICPHKIESSQTATSNESGWTLWPEKLNNLQTISNISVYSGHPNDGAALVPTNESEENGNLIWSFNGEKYRIWMSCVYNQTYLRYVKQLPAGIKKCTLLKSSNKDSSPKPIIGLNCN